MVDTTSPENVALICCKKCKIAKTQDKFPKNRPTCKQCYYENSKKKINDNPDIKQKRDEARVKKYNEDLEYKKRCNDKRKQKYREDEEYRKKLIRQRVQDKQKKAAERKAKELQRIGVGNKECRYCKVIKPKERFRHNRLKCKDCERDEPLEKLKRYIRTRIYNCLRNKNKIKDKCTIDYLDCNSEQYLQYLLSYNPEFTLENQGKEWHIDHVIPVSKFDLDDEDDKYLAFNWRNTMPLSKYENLAKCNRVSQEQLARHIEHLKEYHQKNNIVMPKMFDYLFAKHLDAGKSLRALTTTLP